MLQSIIDKSSWNPAILTKELSGPNLTVQVIISSVRAQLAHTQVSDVVWYESLPRTELDSHANMVVLGKHIFIFESTGDSVDDDGVAQFEAPFTDLLIHSEVYLPQGEEIQITKVISRSKNEDGEVIRSYHENHILNTMVYDV